MRHVGGFTAAFFVVFACSSGAKADTVVMDTVTVGNPGNVGEWSGESYGGVGPDAIVGGVDYTYNISKYEVTNSQYVELLNAVAASDPHNLYSTSMVASFGGITRSGFSGNYTYNTIAGRDNMPVNYVDWHDTLRFANWMHNGQPTGAQGVSTTEDGAYDMSLGLNVVRKPGAQVFLPSEDEWYKAAYYKGGGTDTGYWDYPTQSDTVPTLEAPPGLDMVNGSANYFNGDTVNTTEVGAYDAKPSDSAYGTFDQGGNMWEWNETILLGSFPGLHGGSFVHGDSFMLAAARYAKGPTFQHGYVGFRVAEVPEPATLSLLAFGCLLVTRRRR